MASAPDWQRELRRHGQAVRVATCWLVAVFCSTHALVDMTERVLSLTGHLRIDYPSTVWTSVDRRDAALQDLFGNEPWFLLEGLAYAALGWAGSNPGPTRRRWATGGIAAVAVLTTVGLLSATGVIGKAIVG